MAVRESKRITLLAIGSRGDVQPYVALGKGLRASGHQVQIATHETFRSFVTTHGLGFFPVDGNPKALLEGQEGQAWIASGQRPVRFIRRMIEVARGAFAPMMDDCLAAVAEADLVLFHPLAAFAALAIEEQQGTPVLPAYLQHVHPTGAYPFTGVPPKPALGRMYNTLSYPLAMQLYWQLMRSMVNDWRARHGMSAYSVVGPMNEVRNRTAPFLYGFSRHIIPRPSAWDARVHITGYWFLGREPDWQPPAELVDFLDDGPPPIYMGFGSLVHNDMERIVGITLDALQRVGHRGLLLTGWGGITNNTLPNTVHVISEAPHDWLFPQMAAVVHHGGAGTSSAGFRAGVPSIITPFYADQPFWAWRAEALGIGPKSVPYQELSAERLAEAMREALTNETMRAKAATIGQAMRAEDGVGEAVAVVNCVLGTLEANTDATDILHHAVAT